MQIVYSKMLLLGSVVAQLRFYEIIVSQKKWMVGRFQVGHQALNNYILYCDD